MQLTETQIRNVTKKQLASFNGSGVSIDQDTIIKDAITKQRAEDLFRANILWTLDNAGHKPSSGGKTNKFPSNWRTLSVKQLAAALVMLVLMLTAIVSYSQVKLNIGAVKTDLRRNAIDVGFSYLKSLDSAISGNDYMRSGKNTYVVVTPNIDFRTGTSDAFSSITSKATALFAKFKTTTVDGVVTPDADKTMHVFPVSIGAETNNQLSFVNGLLEIGYEPYYQSPLHQGAYWLSRTNFGVYLQAGKKWRTGLDSLIGGGSLDQSKETNSILRAKAHFDIDSYKLLRLNGFNVGLVGKSDLWYDMIHGAWYYHLEGVARIYLTDQIYFDVNYTKGSGAPNFNTGDQFGGGLTIQF